MTLADKFQVSTYPAFPNFENGSDWFSYDLDGLTKSQFNNFMLAQLAVNFRVYAGIAGGSAQDNKKYTEGVFNGVAYINKNKSADYEPEFDKKITDIRMFVSEDGAYLLKEYDKFRTIGADEIAIFLEIPTGDVLSDNQLLIKAGSNAVQYTKSVLQCDWVNGKYTLSAEEINALLEEVTDGTSLWSKLVSTVKHVEHIVNEKFNETLALGAKYFAGIFEDLRFEESAWNKADDKYLLKTIVQFKEELKNQKIKIENYEKEQQDKDDWVKRIFSTFHGLIDALTDIIDDILKIIDNVENAWALLCGVWNGLMDLAGGLFSIVQMLFEGINALNEYNSNPDYYKALALEYIDNTIQAIQKLDLNTILIYSIKSLVEINDVISNIPAAIKAKFETLNSTHLYYYTGYIIGSFAEIGKLLSALGAISKVDKALEFFDKILGKSSIVEKQTGEKITNIVEVFFKAIEKFIATMKNGTDSFLEFLSNIFAKIRKWIEDTFGMAKEVIDAFISKLPEYYLRFLLPLRKIPKVGMCVVDKLLYIYFEGKTLMTIDKVRMRIVDVWYVNDLEKGESKLLSVLKEKDLELKIIDEKGKEVVKKYKDTIEAYSRKNDNGDILLSFRAEFKAGKVRETDYVDYTYRRTEDYIAKGEVVYKLPPYATRPPKFAKTIDKYLVEGDEFCIVEYLDRENLQPRPGGWASEYECKSIKEVRDIIQVPKEWKNEEKGILVVRRYKVMKGQKIRVREGYIGNLKTGEATGPIQWEFIDGWDKDTYSTIIEEIEKNEIK